ncbi:unnamed protein product [Effrenium voratum]|uniref:J domain-containing protein n=1 Tax=Effrenium voratum TaxID=2562239 RepID=A0AA36HM18_9DINO|nr:unnamed protein product [Effrenium voratum]
MAAAGARPRHEMPTDVRAIRREEYRSRRGLGRQHGALGFLLEMVLCPFAAVVSMLQLSLRLAWGLFTALLTCLVRPHFALGALSAMALAAAAFRQSCAETPAEAGALRLVCHIDSPLALQAWEMSQQAEAFWLASRAWLAGVLDTFEHRLALLLLRGRCPFRDLEEARAACQQRQDLLAVRRSSDCGALRKAYHEGQRQVHPDRLRVQHPACSSEVLQACSVALNLAFEARRAELGCALFREDPEIQHQTNQRELTRLQDLFKKEQVSALERQVAKLTQQLEAAREQTAALEVWNLDLTKKMRQVRRTSSSGSRTLDEGKPREKELLTPQSGAEDGSPEAFIPSPAGRPKSGRPKRPAVRPVAK